MQDLTPEQQERHDIRAERLRRDAARRRRQRIAIPVVIAALAVVGAAFALHPSSAPPAGAAAGAPATAPAATTDTTRAVEATAAPSVETSPSVATTVAPAKEATGPAPLKPLKPAPGVKTIVVDKSAQQVTLYKANGTPVDSFRCASGVVYPRIGTYKVYGHRKQSWSLYDDTTFYYFTQFVKSDKGNNIGFHSIPQNPDGSLVGKLGKPVSHGCVRLAKEKAKFVYTWAVVGTRVVVKQ